MFRRLAPALALLACCLVLPGPASATGLPAGRLFGLQCVEAAGDPHNCEVSLSPPLDGGEAVAVSPGGRFVWAGGADGVLWALRRGALGRLSPVARTQLDSVDALEPGPDGRDVYAIGSSGLGSGRLHVLHVRPDGRLAGGGCFDQGSACGAGNSVPTLANASDVTVSGDGRNVYVAAGSGTDAVSTFDRAEDGSLTYAGCISDSGALCPATAPGLVGAHGVDVSPRGGSVYVASVGPNFGGTADGTVAALERNPDGSLIADGCVEQTLSPATCSDDGPGLVDPFAVVATGGQVYVASRDGFDGARSAVTTLKRESGGALSYGSCYAHTGSSQCGAGRAIPGIHNAFDVALSPDAKTVHVTALGGISMNTGAVTTFSRSATGALAPAGCLGQSGSPEACAGTRVIESAGEAIAISADGANVYAGTATGLAVLGREVAPACRRATAVVPGRTTTVPLPCFDLNGDALERALVAGPAQGDLYPIDDAAGAGSYTPEPGYVGPDFVTFHARGGVLNSNVALLSIQVTNARPRVTRLRLLRKRLRRGRKLPSAARRRAKVGTSIRFRLSEPARVTIGFERARKGRKVGRRCRPPSRRLRSRRRCRRYRKVRGTIRFRADEGGNSVRFQGRISRRRRLKRGSYRLTVTARDPQGLRSRRKRVLFRIVR